MQSTYYLIAIHLGLFCYTCRPLLGMCRRSALARKPPGRQSRQGGQCRQAPLPNLWWSTLLVDVDMHVLPAMYATVHGTGDGATLTLTLTLTFYAPRTRRARGCPSPRRVPPTPQPHSGARSRGPRAHHDKQAHRSTPTACTHHNAHSIRQAHHRRAPAVVLPPSPPEDSTRHTRGVHPTGGLATWAYCMYHVNDNFSLRHF